MARAAEFGEPASALAPLPHGAPTSAFASLHVFRRRFTEPKGSSGTGSTVTLSKRTCRLYGGPLCHEAPEEKGGEGADERVGEVHGLVVHDVHRLDRRAQV